MATERQISRWRDLGFDRDPASEAVQIEDTEFCGGDGRARPYRPKVMVMILKAAARDRILERDALLERDSGDLFRRAAGEPEADRLKREHTAY